MEYIVPSIGRCGTTLIWNLIVDATQRPGRFVGTFEDIPKYRGMVVKTHEPFERELAIDYRAVYMYTDLVSFYASLYNRIRLTSYYLKPALKTRNVSLFRQGVFRRLAKGPGFQEKRKEWALAYLIHNDKLKLIKNVTTWLKSKHTLFVDYRNLCNNKDKTMEQISDFLGLKLPDFELRTRESSVGQMPKSLHKLIHKTYPEPIEEIVKNAKAAQAGI